LISAAVANQLAVIRQQQNNQVTGPVNIVTPFPMTTDTQAPSTSGSSGSSSSRIAQRLAVSGLYSQGHVISSSSALRLNGQPITYPTPIEQTDMSVEPPPYPLTIPPTPTTRDRHLQHSPPPHFYNYRQQSSSPQSSVLSTDSSVRHNTPYKTESERDLDEEEGCEDGEISVSYEKKENFEKSTSVHFFCHLFVNSVFCINTL
jgi:hypothetical protein